MVNKDWTAEEAHTAQKDYLQGGGENSDPLSPYSQWLCLHFLDKLHFKYEEGNKLALMYAIKICAEHELVMPSWVAEIFIKAYDTIKNYESKDWNEVFGSPFPKGANLNALRKKLMLKNEVYEVAKDILLNDPDRAIDAGLFEEVGQKFHIGKTLAEEYCREVEDLGYDNLKDVRLFEKLYASLPVEALDK